MNPRTLSTPKNFPATSSAKLNYRFTGSSRGHQRAETWEIEKGEMLLDGELYIIIDLFIYMWYIYEIISILN